MFQVQKVLLLSQLKRLPLVAVVREYKPSAGSMAGRQAKILGKLVNNSRRKKTRGWFDGDVVVKVSSIASTHNQNKNAPRRVLVLNKLFMKNVTDLLASSKLGEEIAGLGIEFSRVQVCQNFHGLNVFWFSSANDSQLLTIEDRLARIAGPLRHELSQLRLMGEVPRITFVRDKKLSLLNEVDVLLTTADFGEDHERNPHGQRMKKEFDPVNAVIDADDITSDLISMRNDVFGVDRNAIMGRIERSLAKTKNAWEAYERGTINPRAATTNTENTFDSLRQLSAKEKKGEEILQDFLAKRKLERKLKHKNEMSATDLLEMEPSDYRDEWENDDHDDDEDDDVFDNTLAFPDIKFDVRVDEK